jgi:hypothetical protein
VAGLALGAEYVGDYLAAVTLGIVLMIAGFFTAWPANAWLIRAGVKEAM